MVVTLSQQYNVGEKPTVIPYTYIVVTKRYQGQRVLCDTGSLFLPTVCMYVWSTLSAEYGMDQPGVVARICMVTHVARVWIDQARLPILHVVS